MLQYETSRVEFTEPPDIVSWPAVGLLDQGVGASLRLDLALRLVGGVWLGRIWLIHGTLPREIAVSLLDKSAVAMRS